MNWQTHKKQLLKNKNFQMALQESVPEMQIAQMLIEARIKNNLSQKQLADRINTKQSVVSRVENAKTSPSLSFLKKLANALNTTFEIKINPSS